jgi:hypothetical protein
MEPHEAAGTSRGSGGDTGAHTEVGARAEDWADAEVRPRVDAAFAASPGASCLTAGEALLLEALERLDAADSKAAQLESALTHSREIGAAVGILMALQKLTPDEAIELLRQASMAQNVKLHELAARVVETGATHPG